MRFLTRIILVIIGILMLSGRYLVYANNRSVPAPTRDHLNRVLENGIRWVIDHRQEALNTASPILWHMIQKADDVSGDERLESLFAEYAVRYLDNRPNHVWRPLFYRNSWVPVRFERIAEFPYYNQHFIYAITCDAELAKVPAIAAQNDAGLCRLRLRSATCVTHQMMGLMLLQRSRCGDQAQLMDTIKTLQQRIHTQLTWDPRVLDAYMQRVLMLVESGASEMVKPVWLQKLIDAQRADGSWSNFMPLFPLGEDRYIGVKRYLTPEAEAPRSDFHMTAQGILLFTLLTAQAH